MVETYIHISNNDPSPHTIDGYHTRRADSHYPYTEQLERLASNTQSSRVPLPSNLPADIVSPIHVSVWEEQLKSHPDSRFVSLLLRSLANGFNIGFNPKLPRRSAKTNLMLALDHPEIVSAYIEEELGQRNIGLVGRLEDAKHLDIHISPLGAIPKKGRPGKWSL